MFFEWNGRDPQYFDHYIDILYKWRNTRDPFVLERGFHTMNILRENANMGKTLELCSGDGFFTYYFYSKFSTQIDAIDYNLEAINFAKKNNSADNIKYILGDIKTQLPNGYYKNIIWDAGIDDFTEKETEFILNEIYERLDDNGKISGYVSFQLDDSIGNNVIVDNELRIRKLLSNKFSNILIFSKSDRSRQNTYFKAEKANLF